MKQIIQDLNSGITSLEELPVPQLKDGHILIETTRTLVSLGTERMLVKFGQSNLIQKARQQPEKVIEVINKIKTDGIIPTINAVKNKLNQPIPLGYCNVGKVIAVGKNVTEFQIGDRVASNGCHAEYVCVPKNLATLIPENVSDEEATFTVIGSIALQGIRLANPSFGENCVVIGLGLIGLITAQLLQANGCRVIGLDHDPIKVDLAKKFGIETYNSSGNLDQAQTVLNSTNNQGTDFVIITASSNSDEIISNSAKMSRKRGRIILVGVTGLNINRSDFYEKELSFQVSCSYGPGRYDDNYELNGNDYPIGYVRWTEKRNFESVLFAIKEGKLDVKSLISEIIPLSDYNKIYSNISTRKSIASIIRYPEKFGKEQERIIAINIKNQISTSGNIGIIGAGNFTTAMILPCLSRTKSNLVGISSSSGLTGNYLAKKFSISFSTTENENIYKNDDIDLVVITTRHNTHKELVIKSLLNNKHVFVEKPLALNHDELNEIIQAYNNTNRTLTVGFNRRFAILTEKAKNLLDTNSPLNIVVNINAGFIPKESWVQNRDIGGGRIIGEACHFIDLISFITESEVKAVSMNSLGEYPTENTDNASILLRYANGTNATIHYFSNGAKSYPKEKIEIHQSGKTLIIDNWRKLNGFGFKNFNTTRVKQDKGHQRQFDELTTALKNGNPSIIPINSIVNTTKATFAAINSLTNKRWEEIK